MEITSMITLSTEHLTMKTAVLCYDGCCSLASYDDGFFCACDDLAIDCAEDEEAPSDLLDVLRFANSKGCSFIHFNEYAALIPQLPSYR